MKLIVITSFLALGCNALSTKQSRRFPDDFLFGTATAAYQVEGGWNADGKGENIWDRWLHTNPTVIDDMRNGDVACDSYNNYKRDVEMMRELGLDAYRFSISWARILPNGFSNEINEAGVAYYNNFINEMLKYNITPLPTLYHWDLPQKLQDLGGFTNPDISDWFEDYARVAYKLFGDRIKLWITFNEPREICLEGYGDTRKAPGLNMQGIAEYLCAKNLVIAHAKAYHAYNNDFKPTQGGECGITISINWIGAATDSEEDLLAAEVERQKHWGLYAEPIFSENGGFPKEISERVALKSAEQGYPRSRLPEFTDEEKAYVQGTYDFLGMNHYSGVEVSAATFVPGSYPIPSITDDCGTDYSIPDNALGSASSWLFQTPDSIYNALNHFSQKYNYPTIYITENGWSTRLGLIDDDRIGYYRAALESALDALDAGVKLKGYMAWSLLDNFEWLGGYTERLGIYEVDFEAPERTRTPRKSAFVYKEIIRTRVIDHDYEPDTMTMTIDEGH